ncbi:MAG: NAD-dependent epimerase/dehydratase family protein [Bacteroidota bacterium]
MIFVTGGTGLVGSHLLFDLVLKGENVRALKRKNSDISFVKNIFSSHPQLFEKIEWMDGDVLDIFSLQEAIKGISKVYHCAAMVSFIPAEADDMMKININGTANVVNLCLENKMEKLCYVSSVAAVNRINEDETIDENSQWTISKRNSNYAISKYGAEREVWRGIAEGLNAVIVNPTIIFGPGNWKTGSTALFPQIRKGLKFYTDGTTGFVDVRDVSKAMILLMESEIRSERFIINAENLNFKKIFDWIAEGLGKPKPFIYAYGWMRSVAWRAEALKSFLFNTKPFITKETAFAAHKKVHFSNEKIKKAISIEFIELQKCIKETCEIFMKQEANY